MKAYDSIRHHAKRAPNKRAILDLGGRSLSYSELDQRVDRIAAALNELHGVEAGSRVAILAPNSSEMFVLQFACFRLGAIFVPLNWRLAVRELAYIVKDADPTLLIGHSRFASEIDALRSETSAPVISVEEFDDLAATDRPLPAHQPMVDDTVTILYTSGTTGYAKGALLTHRMQQTNAMNLAPAARLSIDSTQLVVLPLFHTGGLNCYANILFQLGGSIVVMSDWDPAEGLRALQNQDLEVTHFFGVPAHYQAMAELPEFADADLKHIVNAGVGGAPVPGPMLERWQGKGVRMQQGYGLTETSPTVTVLYTNRAADKLGSCGVPALHTEVKLVDGDGEEVTTPDTLGEVWVRGPNVTPGYWRNQEATDKAFTDDGWFKTGDAARFDADGFFFIVDRWKDMFISGGENVYPAEVENVIYEMESVAEVAVVGIPNERWGEVGEAVVVLRAGQSVSEEDIIAHCRNGLAKYKVPKSVRFVEALPRNAAGKVLKRELRG
ncbi:MAG: long-chain fatty acid--CoA ligase [Myxococcota bacterium]